MCGGYQLDADPEAVVRAFRVDRSQLELPLEREHYPRQQSPIIVARRLPDGTLERVLGLSRWGLVPAWAKDPSIGDKLYNARAETLSEKASFRESFARRRCIVPVTAFFEWRGPKGHKQRHAFRASDGGLLALAGLWSVYRAGPERIGTFTVVTVDANAVVAEIHDRMPALLSGQGLDAWLDPGTEPARLSALLRPAGDEVLVGGPG